MPKVTEKESDALKKAFHISPGTSQ